MMVSSKTATQEDRHAPGGQALILKIGWFKGAEVGYIGIQELCRGYVDVFGVYWVI